jgi:hypothetical protein
VSTSLGFEAHCRVTANRVWMARLARNEKAIDPAELGIPKHDVHGSSKSGRKSQRNFFEGVGLEEVGCYAQTRFPGRKALIAVGNKDETSTRRPESNVVESGSRRDGGTPDPATAHLGIGILALAAGGTKDDEILLFQKFDGS